MFWLLLVCSASFLLFSGASILAENFLVVKTNESIIIPCNYKQRNISTIVWSYLPIGEKKEHYIYTMLTNETVNNDYKALCEPNKQSCDLVLHQAQKENAGRYTCDFLDDNKPFLSVVELIVGDFDCQSNIKYNHAMIGGNNCPGIEANILERSCSFNYYGNSDVDIQLSWTNDQNNISYGKKTYTKKRNSEYFNTLNFIKIDDKVIVNADLNGVEFDCFIKNFSNIGTCRLPKLEVKYVKPLIENTPEMSMDNLQDTTCSVNKSRNINCAYFWEHKSKESKLRFNRQILTSDDITLPGLYICTAICQLDALKECKIPAMELVVFQSDKNLIIALITILVILSVVIIYLIWLHMKRKYIEGIDDEHEFLNQGNINIDQHNFPRTSVRRPYENLDMINFTSLEPFTDEDEFLFVHQSLIQRWFRWVRVSELLPNTVAGVVLLNQMDLMQHSTYFFIILELENKIGIKLISNMIHPQNRQGETIYNPSGKYAAKFHFRERSNTIIIDDKLPVDKNGNLLCSFSKGNNMIWFSLFEKAYKKFLKINKLSAFDIEDFMWITGWIPFKYYSHTECNVQKLKDAFLKNECFIILRKNPCDSEFYILLNINITERNWTFEYKRIQDSYDNSSIFTEDYDSVDSWKQNYFLMFVLWSPNVFIHHFLKQNPTMSHQYRLEVADESTIGDNETIVLLSLSKKHHSDDIKMVINRDEPNINNQPRQHGQFIELRASRGHHRFNLLIYGSPETAEVDFNLNIYSSKQFTLTEPPHAVLQNNDVLNVINMDNLLN